ncbi:hypothetical protein AMJ57_01430 [Parcubacteria bacterium SG8_24]|nr:MAG: hypothetical protein AMJ57_01430 [Parcubacteria bacterium SG8_24]
MRICLISNLYGAQARGGAESIVAAEAAGLVGRGHEVFVLSGAPEGQETGRACRRDPGEAATCGLAWETGPDGVNQVRLHAPNIYFYPEGDRKSWPTRALWHLLDTFNVQAARRVGESLREIGPDVVHTHNLMGLGFLIPRLLRRRGLRQLHTVHDVQLLHPSGLLPEGYFRRPVWLRPHQASYAALLRRLFGSPGAVVFPSDFLRRLHERYGFFPQSDRLVLRNPAPETGPVPEEGEASAPVFLFVGQLERHKGLRVLLEAWSAWADRGEAVLEIAGAGPLDGEVRSRAAADPSIRPLGRLEGAELVAAYRRAAYSVLPSTVMENAPAVIMESFGHGTPVIAAAVGGVPELIGRDERGRLFPPGDADALAMALSGAAADPRRRQELSGAARAFAAEHGLERHLDRLEEAYRDLLAG